MSDNQQLHTNTFLAGGKEVSSEITTDFASSKFCSLFLAASSCTNPQIYEHMPLDVRQLDSPVTFGFCPAYVVQPQIASSSFSSGSVMPPPIAMATDVAMQTIENDVLINIPLPLSCCRRISLGMVPYQQIASPDKPIIIDTLTYGSQSNDEEKTNLQDCLERLFLSATPTLITATTLGHVEGTCCMPTTI